MDVIALGIVSDYRKYGKKGNSEDKAQCFIVWKAKTLQNWKYLISTDAADGMYYELTYNGDKKEWYLDVYKKQANVVIKDREEAAIKELGEDGNHVDHA